MGVEIWDPTLASSGIECLPPVENTAHTATSVVNFSVTSNRSRRCLFGDPPINHEEVSSCVKQNLAKIQEEMKKKWNFDFINDRPINHVESRYHWLSTSNCGNSRLWKKCTNDQKRNNDNKVTKIVQHHYQRSSVHTNNKKHKNNFSSPKIDCNRKQLTITDFMHCTKKFNNENGEKKYYLRSKIILVPDSNKINHKNDGYKSSPKKRLILRRLPKRKVTIKC